MNFLSIFAKKTKTKRRDKSISTICFISDDIATLIQNLDSNKAHVNQSKIMSHGNR